MPEPVQLDRRYGWWAIYVIIRTSVISFLTVMGMYLALAGDIDCNVKLVCWFVGTACGSLLFLQIAITEIVRYYEGREQRSEA